MKHKLLLAIVLLLLAVAPPLASYAQGAGPLNDDFLVVRNQNVSADAVPGEHYYAELYAATWEAGERSDCLTTNPANFSGMPTVWYRWTAPDSTPYAVGWDAWNGQRLAVYAATSANPAFADLQLVACGSGGSYPLFPQPGTTYYFQLADPALCCMAGFWLSPPTIEVGMGYTPDNPAAHDPVTFTALASDGLGLSNPSCHWTFGDGTAGEGCNIAHAYTADGSYDVSVTMTTVDGRSKTAALREPVRVVTPGIVVTNPGRSSLYLPWVVRPELGSTMSPETSTASKS